MSPEILINKYNQSIEKLLKRLALNYIVCAAPQDNNGKVWTKRRCFDWLKDRSHKLPIRNIFMLNDYNDKKIKVQQQEYEALEKSLMECSMVILKVTDEYCDNDGNLYKFNSLIKETIDFIDTIIGSMNYDSWLMQTSENDNDNIFFVQLGGKLIPMSKMEIDITSYCMNLINYNFAYRTKLLYDLKCFLVDIYSERLLLPSVDTIPQFSYSCSPTDICELLLAITNSGVFDDIGKLRAILLEIFNVTPEFYNRASYDIRNRVDKKSIFVQHLSEGLNKLSPQKKKTSSK